MALTIALMFGLIAILFLMILTATLTLPSKALTKSFPKDVRESLAPRLDNLPMSGKRIFGIVLLIILGAAMLGMVIIGGVNGIKHGYDFWRFLLRFLIMFGGVKIFDIIGLDYFLLSRSRFFSIFFPKRKIARVGRISALIESNKFGSALRYRSAVPRLRGYSRL